MQFLNLTSIVPLTVLLWFCNRCTGGSDNPVLTFDLCEFENPDKCSPTRFGANSTFAFGDITTSTFFYDTDPFTPSLIVACTASEPLRWRVDGNTGTRLTESMEMESSASPRNSSGLVYRYKLFLRRTVSGRVRCESYENASRAAEIYVVRNSHDVEYVYPDGNLLTFPALPLDDSTSLLIPCRFTQFDPHFNIQSVKLLKAPISKILINEATEDCLHCFPQASPARNPESCVKCGPFGITRGFWDLAGRPRHLRVGLPPGDEDYEFRLCASHYNCSVLALRSVQRWVRQCNHDTAFTCSDYFTTLRAYPEACSQKSSEVSLDYISIESCLMEFVGKVIDSEEANFDPRLGFRLKGVPDYDAVYMCPAVGKRQHRLHLAQFDPKIRINVSLYLSHKSSPQTTGGIICTMSQWIQEYLQLEMIECSTLSDCELRQWSDLGARALRYSPHMLRGDVAYIPGAVGKVITKPFSHGIVRCYGRYRLKVGYAEQAAHLFTGLDKNSYFTVDRFPADAVINLVPKSGEMKLGLSVRFTCTISSFILFPTFRFVLHFANGSNTSEGVQTIGRVVRRFTVGQSFSLLLPENYTGISCLAPSRNSFKWLSVADTSQSSVQTTILSVVGIASVVVILICLTILGLKKYTESKSLRQLTHNETAEFLHGYANDVVVMDNNHLVNLSTAGVAFPEHFHISPADVKTGTIIGQGQFGLCFSGEYQGRRVAVKIAKQNLDVDAFKEFLREIKLMAYIGRHENIVEFIGAVVTDISERSCKFVLELSPQGDLLHFLRGLDANDGYVQMYEKLECHHLSHFCQQIAAGMEFLGTKRVIHGDLAARNVLVFPNFVVKLTDFGLSRRLYNYAVNYVKKRNTYLPWRWMALESLKYMAFSTMSDMWAFGVTVWEIFTMGQVPFAHMRFSSQFQHELENGLRLEKPKRAADEIYEFMSSTWNQHATSRPSFTLAKVFFRGTREAQLRKPAACVNDTRSVEGRAGEGSGWKNKKANTL